MGELRTKRFDEPDEVLDLPHLQGRIVVVGDTYVGRFTHEPGWRWSEHVKPLAGTPSCQHHHQGVVLSGRMEFVTDAGARRTCGPGVVYDVPPGHDGWVVGDEPCVVIEFRGVRGWGKGPSGERFMATLVLTDVVGSTGRAASLGDEEWQRVLGRHYERLRLELERFHGTEVKTTGDGLLAIFDSTARAVRCAAAWARVRHDGLEVRVGVHSGEVERLPEDLGGVAVHALARITDLAEAGEVLLSTSTVSLLEGVDVSIEDGGEHELRGLPGRRRLYRLLSA